MNLADIPDGSDSFITPEALHRAAAAQLERAAMHHRNAALYRAHGYTKEADIHANVAHLSAAKALSDSANALKLAHA